MTNKELRELAESVPWKNEWFDVEQLREEYTRFNGEDAAFIIACAPERIIALVDENEMLMRKLEECDKAYWKQQKALIK